MFGILDVSERIYKLFGESQFYNASFLLGLLLKYAGLQKIQLWASVWDFGFQRMHIQIFGESQFGKSNFSIGACAKNTMAYIKSHFGHRFHNFDFSERTYKFPVNLSFVIHNFY